MTSFIPIITTIIILDIISMAIPGQDFTVVTRNSLHYSKKAGIFTAIGIATAITIHSLLAIFGINALLATHHEILAGIKTLGAIYLIYLGTQFFKNAGKSTIPDATQTTSKQPANLKQCFTMGFMSNILNADAILTIISIFTVVIPTNSPLWFSLLCAGIIFLDNLIWWSAMSHIFSLKTVQQFFFKYTKRIEQIGGALLIFLGSKNLYSSK
jgi:threonine/homoserine/homoserine lactone efflux protein